MGQTEIDLFIKVPRDADLGITIEDVLRGFLDRKAKLDPGSPATSKQVGKLRFLGFSGKAELLTVKQASEEISRLEGVK